MREPGGRANFGRRLSQSVLPAAWNHRPTCTLTTCSFASCSTRGFSFSTKTQTGKKRAKCRVEWRRHVVSTPAIRLDGIPRTFVSLSLGLGLVHGQNLHDPTFALPAADHRHRRLLVAYTRARQALIETRSDDAPGYKYSYSQIELVTVSARVGRWAGMASDGPGAGRGYSTTSSSELRIRTRSTRKEGGRDGLAAPATDRQTSQWRRCHRPPSCPHRTPLLHGSQSAVVEVSLVCVSSVLRCFALLAVVAHEARVSLVVRPSVRSSAARIEIPTLCTPPLLLPPRPALPLPGPCLFGP